MDIKITCRACDRTYPLTETLDPEGRPGHCPFCGQALAFQYTSTFIDTAERVLGLAPELARQLTLLAELAGGFAIEVDSVIEPMSEALSKQDQAISEPYRPSWPPAPSERLS